MNASNPNGFISAVAGGTEGTDGPSTVAPGHHHTGGFCPCLQLVAGARAIHKARNNRGNVSKGNVFDHGCWNNCLDFWTESTKGKSSVNYYELYNVHQLNNRTFTLQATMEV